MKTEDLFASFKVLNLPLKPADYSVKGVHAESLLEKSEWRKAVKLLLEKGFYLVFKSAVSLKPASCVVAHFASFEAAPLRISLKLFAYDNEAPTITDIFHAASWYEREIHDFFGISFTDNKDMRPLILSEMDSGFYPLFKEEAACLDAARLGFIDIDDNNLSQDTSSEGGPEIS